MLIFSLVAPLIVATSPAPASPFVPLHLYNGGWKVTIAEASKPDSLLNRCTETAAYYACEQVLNGKPIALVVFTFTEDARHFHSQVVLPDGKAVGRSDLTIDGPHWTYSSSGTDKNDKPIYYRTENYFDGDDKIHFEQSESADQKTWVKKMQGDEVRASR
jgi:hypothetical protein